MNANELADELHKIYIQEAAECWDVVEEAATMLRQQQEKLTKYELRHAEQRKRIEELEAKTLTDEEILDIWYAMKDDSNNWTRYVDFARAILRKAQEE